MVVATLAAIMLASCGAETTEKKAADEGADKAADVDQSPLSSCEMSEMAKLRVDVLSYADEAAVCRAMQSGMGRLPSVALARAMCKTIAIMQAVYGDKDSPKDVAYQMMNIVEARGQEKDDKAIHDTFNTVAQIFGGTEGHVTPKDLNICLRSAGPIAKTLNDDFLMNMATLIWEDKKSRGE